MDRASAVTVIRHHLTDTNESAGGTVTGAGIDIKWKDWPLDSSGASVADVIDAAIARLRFFQGTKLAGEHNAKALEFLACARLALIDESFERVVIHGELFY
jgi:hypothetical protein